MVGISWTLMANGEAIIGPGSLASQPHWFYRAKIIIIKKKENE